MCAHKSTEPRSAGSRSKAALTWLGGAHWRELDDRHERSTHAVAGAVVLLYAALAWLIATLAVGESTGWPVLAVAPLTLVFAVLVGAVTRAVASGPTHGRPGIVGRGAVAVGIGVVVGELAALVLLSGSIDRNLSEQAMDNAGATPAVILAAGDLDRAHDARTVLDDTVEQARGRRNAALVIARCEYHPTPACPQTHITGVPGLGPETRTAEDLLADNQRELDDAVANRDRQARELDARIGDDELTLMQARQTAIANADRGLGARWVAMHNYTLAGAGPLLLRVLTVAFFALLSVLPLILAMWRGKTTHDRYLAARAERDRAELEADTAIAVKRAEVRAAAEILWAEQQLAKARLATEAQTEIDRARYHHRVVDAINGPAREPLPPKSELVEEDMYLPIAAEAEAASQAVAELPAGAQHARATETENLPATVESAGTVETRGERGAPLIPTIPDVTRAAARWIRPLVPPFVARVIDTTTTPLRSALQVFEEVEEITFSFKRTHKVTVNSAESQDRSVGSAATDTRVEQRPAESSIAEDDGFYVDCERLGANAVPASSGRVTPEDPSLEPTGRQRQAELMERDELPELRAADGPRQLPPAE